MLPVGLGIGLVGGLWGALGEWLSGCFDSSCLTAYPFTLLLPQLERKVGPTDLAIKLFLFCYIYGVACDLPMALRNDDATNRD